MDPELAEVAVDRLIRVVKRNQLRHTVVVLLLVAAMVSAAWGLVERRVGSDFWQMMHEIRKVQDAVESTRCACRPLSEGAETVGSVITRRRLDETSSGR